MGMFDSVMVNGVEYQTKAFGKRLRNYTIDSFVILEQAPVTTEDFYSFPEGLAIYPIPSIYQVECLGEGYAWLIVEDNHIKEVTFERNSELPTFDYYGRIYNEEDPYVQSH